MPLACVTACKVIPAMLAKVNRERVLLSAVTVPLELAPCFELGVGAESALDLANRPTCPVGLRRREECLAPGLEVR